MSGVLAPGTGAAAPTAQLPVPPVAGRSCAAWSPGGGARLPRLGRASSSTPGRPARPRLALQTVKLHGPPARHREGAAPAGRRGPRDEPLVARPGRRGPAMAAHPWVRTVEVTRSLPDTLQLRVEERAPVALASLGDLYVVDARRCAVQARARPPSRSTCRCSPASTARRRRRIRQAPRPPPRGAGRGRGLPARLRAPAALRGPARRGQLRAGHRRRRPGGARTRRTSTASSSGSSGCATSCSVAGLLAAAIHLENRVRPGWVAVQVQPGATAPCD